jgi:hypothetical protein
MFDPLFEELANRPQDDFETRRLDLGVASQEESDRKRKAHDPLPDSDLGDDGIDEVGRSLGHAPSTAAGADPAFLARKGHDSFVTAGLTAKSQESVSQDPAAQKLLKLIHHMARKALALDLGGLQEGIQVLGDDLIEDALLGVTPDVVWACGIAEGAETELPTVTM